jgi:hypothetical protein
VVFDLGSRRVLARVGTAKPERVFLFEGTILAQADGGGEEGVGGGASLWCVGGGGGGGWSGGERATLSWFGLGEGVCFHFTGTVKRQHWNEYSKREETMFNRVKIDKIFSITEENA